MKNKIDYDVVIIGGGPAGATAATFLQKQGHKCLILEQSKFPRYHVGESLIPHTHGIFKRMGLLPKMQKSDYPEKRSVRFVAPSGREADPFYFTETIKGEGSRTWQVERSTFDVLCLDHARDSGADVIMEEKVDSVIFREKKACGVRVREKGKKRLKNIYSKVVIDASGRSTMIGKQLGLKSPVKGLKKASIWTYYKGGYRQEGIDAGETTIFMIPGGGWFWYIPLPDDIVSVGIVDSPENLFAESRAYKPAFMREVKKCKPLQKWLKNAEQVDSIRGLPTLAYLNKQMSGDGWVMIGDSAAFLDPIYSSGLFLAMGSAELAANSIHAALDQNDLSGERLGAHIPDLKEGVELVRSVIHAFYDPKFNFRDFVKRFPDQRAALIDCLVGDVVCRDMSGFLEDLWKMTAPPPELV